MLALLTLGSVSHATETIYITGSTAFRKSAILGIQALLGTSPAGNNTPTAQSNATLTSANAINWMGKTYNGHTVNIQVSFFGAVGGIQTVSNSIAWPFLKPGLTGTQSLDPTNPADPNGDLQVPQIAFGDSWQSATPFTTNMLANDIIVGVVPFQWVASYGTPTGLSFSPQIANALFTAGNTPLALLTGSTTDRTTLMANTNIGGVVSHNAKPAQLFAIGRDADSGTRVIAFAESGIGVNTTVTQYKPTTSGTAIASHVYYPAATINGIDYDMGNTGYNSGGTLAGLMRYSTSATIGGYYVTYLGKSDATTALSTGATGVGNAVALNWNGVAYWNGTSFNDTAITEGQYTFWGYEHVMFGSLTNDAAVFAPALAAAIKGTSVSDGTASQAGISIYAMKVTRPGDGAQIAPAY